MEAAPTAAEVDALAAAIAVKAPMTQSPIREAAAAASAALAARSAATQAATPPAASKPAPIAVAPAAAVAPTVALHTVNGQAVGVQSKKSTAGQKPGEPKIFVAPRAPDDPGPEPATGTPERTVRGL